MILWWFKDTRQSQMFGLSYLGSVHPEKCNFEHKFSLLGPDNMSRKQIELLSDCYFVANDVKSNRLKISVTTAKIFLNGPTPASFLLIFSLFKQKIQFFTTNQCAKNVTSIQYTVPGFEPTTSRTWIISNNHSRPTVRIFTQGNGQLLVNAKWGRKYLLKFWFCV